MRADRQIVLAWSMTAVLVGASVLGALLVAGDNGEGLLTLFRRLEDWSETAPWTAALTFTAIFALTTALTLPTATVLCVSAGYLFGTVTGTLVSLAGAVGGAMLTFALMRFIAGDRVRDFLLTGRTRGLIRLLERDAFFYLVAFRIVPVAPFFAINAAGAMIGIPVQRYFVATALGLAPIMLVYASVGSGLDTLLEAGRISGPAVILEPKIALPLLALLVLLAAGTYLRRRVARRRQRRDQPHGG